MLSRDVVCAGAFTSLGQPLRLDVVLNDLIHCRVQEPAKEDDHKVDQKRVEEEPCYAAELWQIPRHHVEMLEKLVAHLAHPLKIKY